ncbi:hypothetical protein [Frankia sp. Cr2]|uniref:hypothetical protein n=1 Tax=Frankia sp. Cr2 TaxID=3073932 RepID=UPI002AD44E2A|nr:hypothetical protein [Frankia sp. Cr2]
MGAGNRAQALTPTADTDPTVTALTTVTASARVGGISTGTDRDGRVTVNGYEAKAGLGSA